MKEISWGGGGIPAIPVQEFTKNNYGYMTTPLYNFKFSDPKFVRKFNKYRFIEFCPPSSSLGDSSPGKAGKNPSVLLPMKVTAASGKSSVGELWAQEEASGDVLCNNRSSSRP